MNRDGIEFGEFGSGVDEVVWGRKTKIEELVPRLDDVVGFDAEGFLSWCGVGAGGRGGGDQSC